MGPEALLSYISVRLPELWLRTGEHIMLTGCSTLGAILMGVPMGVLLFRKSWLRGPVLGAAGILQTIPSLAMLVFLLALLQKIGTLPALIALTLYALLPIIRNSLTGLSEVPPEIGEAARGMGMTEGQELRMIRIPLALPVIMAGVRTAAVVSVGIATLSAFIGAGGLGQFINRGLALSNTRLILLGAVPAALLALLVDLSIGFFQWGLQPERKREKDRALKRLLRTVAFAVPLLWLAVGLVTHLSRPTAGGDFRNQGRNVIRIGSKNFTEQILLGEIMAQLIEAKTDLTVERRFNLGGTMICHGALAEGEIDLYAEYTGTGLTAILKQPVISEPAEVYPLVSERYRKRFGVRWLKPFGFNNTYAVTVRGDDAKRHGWEKLSDLKGVAPHLKAGFTAEFAERPDGYPGLRKAYDMTFREVRDLDPSLMYKAIANGEVDVICAFATDGRITAYQLQTLQDDRHFFPPYHAAPIIREEFLRACPELEDVLTLPVGALNNERMRRLNLEVDQEKRQPSEVVERFLTTQGLLQKTD